MNTEEKNKFFDLIHSNIETYGYHLTTVKSVLEPRYAYTIGLNKLLGFELIFAGGAYYLNDDLYLIIKNIINELSRKEERTDLEFQINTLGSFTISEVDPSWSHLMILGAFDYYKTKNVRLFQILPDRNHYTLDIPEMRKVYNPSFEPVWHWLDREWEYPVPKDSTVVTNIYALLGEPITEIMRWELNEWEMFAGAGPDVLKKDMRIMSLSTMIGIDNSLLPSLDLEIGKGLWRDSKNSNWNSWG